MPGRVIEVQRNLNDGDHYERELIVNYINMENVTPDGEADLAAFYSTLTDLVTDVIRQHGLLSDLVISSIRQDGTLRIKVALTANKASRASGN